MKRTKIFLIRQKADNPSGDGQGRRESPTASAENIINNPMMILCLLAAGRFIQKFTKEND